MRVLLHREGWAVGKERFYRVYTEEGLALRRKRPWRHATAVHREQRRPATARNDIWSMDFVADELADGRKFRTLTAGPKKPGKSRAPARPAGGPASLRRPYAIVAARHAAVSMALPDLP